MVNRNILQVEDILYSEQLVCYPAENQAAKIFIRWLKEHPEYQESDVDIRIDSYEREEDYHGNGGGYDRYIRIFKKREETNEEREIRIKNEENKEFNNFNKNIRIYVSDLIRELSIYPNVISDEITAKINEIINIINTDVKNCLNSEKQNNFINKEEVDDYIDAISQAIIALEDIFDEDCPLSCYAGYSLSFDKAIEKLKSLQKKIQNIII